PRLLLVRSPGDAFSPEDSGAFPHSSETDRRLPSLSEACEFKKSQSQTEAGQAQATASQQVHPPPGQVGSGGRMVQAQGQAQMDERRTIRLAAGISAGA